VKQTRHNHILKALGKRLRVLRLKSNLSQEELAWKADLEISQISRIERGIVNTSISQLFSIAEALEIPLKELFDFELLSSE
jgi:transcriptional regulator with XRE-family HTH domain